MTTTPETRIQRHPVRGFFFGLLLGLSAAIYLVLFAITPFRIATVVAVVAAGGLFGALWGSVAPAKKLTEVPPTTAAFGTTYVSTGDVDRGPSPTYEETFGRSPADDEDDGTFGAPGESGQPPDAAFGARADDGMFGAPSGGPADVPGDDGAFGAPTGDGPVAEDDQSRPAVS